MARRTLYLDTTLQLEPWSAGTPPVSPLDKPANLRQTANSSSSFTLAWDGVTGATGYRLRINGATVYMPGLSLTYTVTNQPASTNGTAEVEAIGNGSTTTNSGYSAAVGVGTSAAGAKLKMLFFHDVSLGAEYYQADGTRMQPSPSFTGTPNPQQFSGKLAALVQGGVKVVNNSYPGFNMYDLTTDGAAPSNGNVNVVADADAVFAANTDRDIDMVSGGLENGFDIYTLAQMKARWDTYNTLYKSRGVKRIFHRVPVFRAGAFSNTVDGDNYTNIMAMRAYMRQQAAASGGTVFVAADADGPNITAQGYPQNPQYCNQNDYSNGQKLQVHFTEYGVTEQANEIRALLAANGYAFSGAAVSVGTGGVSDGNQPVPQTGWKPNANVSYTPFDASRTGGASGNWPDGFVLADRRVKAPAAGQTGVIATVDYAGKPANGDRIFQFQNSPANEGIFTARAGWYLNSDAYNMWDGDHVPPKNKQYAGKHQLIQIMADGSTLMTDADGATSAGKSVTFPCYLAAYLNQVGISHLENLEFYGPCVETY